VDRLNQGRASPQSVAHLFQETARQRQREQVYAASARRLADAGGPGRRRRASRAVVSASRPRS
jgi:hypothetical protein